MSDARVRLLDDVIRELDENGLRDRSLRDIAAAVGTSHRMLIHHFGSREGLLVAVVDAVESAERAEALKVHLPSDDPDEAMRITWRRLTRPAMAGRERLFFECYARGLQGEEPFASMFPGAVTTWVDEAAGVLQARGMPRREARAQARLSLAIVRGLLLDLLATGDRRSVNDALEAFLALRPEAGW
jgi:AcrR family transcriptional regulator